jgi:hypothetical protein
MRKVDNLSKEVKEEIIRLYSETNTPTTNICAMYGFGSSTLMSIIKEAGIPYRRPSASGKKKTIKEGKKKYCRSCGSRLSPKGSKFCCECGKPLYTEKEMILAKLEHLTNYFIAIDHVNRDKYIGEVNDIINAIKKLKVIEE